MKEPVCAAPKVLKPENQCPNVSKLPPPAKCSSGALVGATCCKAKIPNAAGHCERQPSSEPQTFIESNRTSRSAIDPRCFARKVTQLQGILQPPGIVFAADLEGGFRALAPETMPRRN
jgi:hypothetical protein